MNVPDILRNALQLTDWKQKGLAQRAGVSQGTVSKWLSESQSPNKKEWDRFIEALRKDKRTRHLAEGAMTSSVPIMGYIGAGAVIEPEYEQVPEGGLDPIDLPFAVPSEIVAFVTRGDSMIPVYRDGDAILVWKEQRLPTENYVGEEAAVRTGQGHRYLK